MMKRSYVVGLILCCTMSVWGAVNESKEEALKRYGKPDKWGRNRNDAEFIDKAFYTTEDPKITLSFFINKTGQDTLGELEYRLPAQEAQAESLVNKLLELNADGKEWKPDRRNSRDRYIHSYSRDGAKAQWALKTGRFLITLEEYEIFCDAQREAIKQRKKDEEKRNGEKQVEGVLRKLK